MMLFNILLKIYHVLMLSPHISEVPGMNHSWTEGFSRFCMLSLCLCVLSWYYSHCPKTCLGPCNGPVFYLLPLPLRLKKQNILVEDLLIVKQNTTLKFLRIPNVLFCP